MNCHEFNSKLIDLVYGELLPDEAARCREHAAVCFTCAAALAALEQTQRALDELATQQTRVDLARLCLKMSAQHKRARGRWLWTGASAAAVVLVALGLASMAVRVDVAPDQVVLAWRAANADSRPDASPPHDVPSGNDSGPAGNSDARMADAGSARETTTQADSLATARDRYLRSGRYLSPDSTYLDARDRVLALGLDSVPRATFAAPLAERSNASPPSYQELRKQLLSSSNLRPST